MLWKGAAGVLLSEMHTYVTVIPRSARNSVTSRKLSAKRRYIQAARWMISRRKMLLEYKSEFMRSRYGAQSTLASQQVSLRDKPLHLHQMTQKTAIPGIRD
jgi:monoamine oxidase